MGSYNMVDADLLSTCYFLDAEIIILEITLFGFFLIFRYISMTIIAQSAAEVTVVLAEYLFLKSFVECQFVLVQILTFGTMP